MVAYIMEQIIMKLLEKIINEELKKVLIKIIVIVFFLFVEMEYILNLKKLKNIGKKEIIDLKENEYYIIFV